MRYRKISFKIDRIDPKQLKFEFQTEIDSSNSNDIICLAVKNEESISNGIQSRSLKREFEYINESSLKNHTLSIQEDVDMTDVEFIYYIFNRVGEEFKEDILKAIKYEYEKKLRMKDKSKFLKLSENEINERMSSIYSEIGHIGEIKFDDIREILLFFNKDELEELIDSIEELDEVYQDTIDYSYVEE